jgi:hypothetical protein
MPPEHFLPKSNGILIQASQGPVNLQVRPQARVAVPECGWGRRLIIRRCWRECPTTFCNRTVCSFQSRDFGTALRCLESGVEARPTEPMRDTADRCIAITSSALSQREPNDLAIICAARRARAVRTTLGPSPCLRSVSARIGVLRVPLTQPGRLVVRYLSSHTTYGSLFHITADHTRMASAR